jgi:hypothetical protein
MPRAAGLEPHGRFRVVKRGYDRFNNRRCLGRAGGDDSFQRHQHGLTDPGRLVIEESQESGDDSTGMLTMPAQGQRGPGSHLRIRIVDRGEYNPVCLLAFPGR